MGSYQAEGMYIVQVRVRTEEDSFLWVHIFSTAAQWPKIQQNCNFDTVFPKGLNQHLLSRKEESKRVKIFLASKATSNSMILEW